jgi:hypothetical protein
MGSHLVNSISGRVRALLANVNASVFLSPLYEHLGRCDNVSTVYLTQRG